MSGFQCDISCRVPKVGGSYGQLLIGLLVAVIPHNARRRIVSGPRSTLP